MAFAKTAHKSIQNYIFCKYFFYSIEGIINNWKITKIDLHSLVIRSHTVSQNIY